MKEREEEMREEKKGERRERMQAMQNFLLPSPAARKLETKVVNIPDFVILPCRTGKKSFLMKSYGGS